MSTSRTFFSKQFGHVAAMHDPALPSSISFRVENWGGFNTLQAIITNMTVSASGNFQFLHTLGGNVFVYVFGDRIGKVTISGIAFEGTCGGFFGSVFRGSKVGVERVLDYYWRERIAGRKTPIKVTIGAGTILVGYVTSITARVEDEASRRFSFNIELATILNRPRATGTAGTSSRAVATSSYTSTTATTLGTPFPSIGSLADSSGSLSDPAVSTAVTAIGYSAHGTGPGHVITPTPTTLE